MYHDLIDPQHVISLKNRCSQLERLRNFDAIGDRWLKTCMKTTPLRLFSVQCGRPNQIKISRPATLSGLPSPRGHYPLARVSRLHYGKNAVARSAE